MKACRASSWTELPNDDLEPSPFHPFLRHCGSGADFSIPAVAADAKTSKVHDCGDSLKLEVFEPKDGVMEAHVEDLTVRISVKDGGTYSPASYRVSVVGVVEASASEADKALATACELIATYNENRKAPSAEDRQKQLS